MMKGIYRSKGVTLLEIMLVLAISAMILISSIRYYQSATVSLHANSALEQIQAITASVDHFIAGSSSYENISTEVLASLLPNNSLLTPWGTNITVNSADPTSYSITFANTPASSCQLMITKLETNKHFKVTSTCHDVASDFTYTYLSNA